jgi:hypothetical protein
MVNTPEQLEDLYKGCGNGNHKADLPNLREILKLFAQAEELHDIFIVVDAIDECPNNQKDLRKELLDSITEIRSWSPSNIHLLVTSRQEPDIETELTSLFTAPTISIKGAEVEADIKKYIAYELATDQKLSKWSDDLRAEIETTLTKETNGM